MWAVYLLQAALIVAVSLRVVERCRVLLFEAPVGSAFLRALERCCESGRGADARRLVTLLPRTWAARVASAGLSEGEGALAAMEEELLDLRARASRGLRALRISATLASTLGLLGAIVAIVQGLGQGDVAALGPAGLADRSALNRALLTMAIGVATSGVIFYAFGMLRRAAIDALSQTTRAARAVEGLLHGD